MLDVLNQDYIRTAYAKGLSSKQVIFKHALRNALNPVITAITGWFAELLAGAFFIEYIFIKNQNGKNMKSNETYILCISV
jgi:peptide/nickel transport system permease protein